MGIEPPLERTIARQLADARLDLAAASIVRGYGPQILGYLRALRPRDADADAVFAVFCAELWSALPAFPSGHDARIWSYQRAWTALRSTSSPAAPDSLLHEARAVKATALTPEAAQHLMALRAELDDEEQTLLVLRLDRDLEWPEIARVVENNSASQTPLRKRYEVLVERIRKLAKERGLRPGPG